MDERNTRALAELAVFAKMTERFLKTVVQLELNQEQHDEFLHLMTRLIGSTNPLILELLKPTPPVTIEARIEALEQQYKELLLK